MDSLHKVGPAASFLRGRAVAGRPSGELRSWRLAAARSAGKLPSGAALGRRFRAAEVVRGRALDPGSAPVAQALATRAALLRSGDLPPAMMQAGLATAVKRQKASGFLWATCRRRSTRPP